MPRLASEVSLNIVYSQLSTFHETHLCKVKFLIREYRVTFAETARYV